jgi:hypothetical protein
MCPTLDQQYQPQVIGDRQRPAEDQGTDRFAVAADCLFTRIDAVCSRLQWLIGNSNNRERIESQTEAIFVQA